jgi:hypothetical protein
MGESVSRIQRAMPSTSMAVTENVADESRLTRDMPPEIIERVFDHLGARFTIKRCALVCKRWANIVQNQSYWLQRCLNESILVGW